MRGFTCCAGWVACCSRCWSVSFVAYVALTFAPGDAAEALIGENASAEQVAALRQQMQLDAPLLERYGDYMAGASPAATLASR